LPQNLAAAHIDGFEVTIQVPREHHSACCEERRREEWRALFDGPKLLHGVYVKGRQLADVAIGAGHFVEAPARAPAAAAALLQIDLFSVHRQAALAQRNDQTIGSRVV
jgi:hypothetical protein